MNPAIQAFLGLGINMALPDQAAEGGLNVGARAAKPVIQVKVTECSVEVVPPHQADHAAPKPDAFRVARRPVEHPRRLGDFVNALLALLGSVWSLFLLLRRVDVAALGKRSRAPESANRYAENRKEVTQRED